MTGKEIVQALRCCAKGLGHDDLAALPEWSLRRFTTHGIKCYPA